MHICFSSYSGGQKPKNIFIADAKLLAGLGPLGHSEGESASVPLAAPRISCTP